MSCHRRGFLKLAGQTAFGAPLLMSSLGRVARAANGRAQRVIFFYFPDGVAAASQNGEPSAWHATGTETNFQLPMQIEPLARHRERCIFLNGLSMGGTDAGSHPGGAKKLLTAVDGGQGESIDQFLARTVGADSPHRHLYLGAMANHNGASGDKHISYPNPGQSTAPEDDPRRAFSRLFGAGPVADPTGGGESAPPKTSVIDGVLADLRVMSARLGNTEKAKLDFHLESLREVERRIKAMPPAPPMGTQLDCEHAPSSHQNPPVDGELYEPGRFPQLLRMQIDLMVQAMACGLTRVGTIQGSHHTSELVMSRFPGTEMYDPGFDMRSHQASHYGASHDLNHREYRDFVLQRRWWVEQFAYLMDQLAARPEGEGTMLDNTLLLMCSEVSDGNTHSHDDMPFVLAGGAGGAIRTGRLLSYGYARHSNLLVTIARAMGSDIQHFGHDSSGPLAGVLA